MPPRKERFKKFTYQGIDLDRLVELSHEQFSELVNSRTQRKFRRGIHKGAMKLMKKLRKARTETPFGEKPAMVKTHLRDMIIVPEMFGSVVGVHNGNSYVGVEIKPEMVGHYLGEFSLTYKPIRHGKPDANAADRVSVVENQLDGKVKNFVWLGEKGRTALARTQYYLYLSTDAGKSWKKQNDALCDDNEKCVTKIVVSPVNPNMVFLVGSESVNWAAKDINTAEYRKVEFESDGKPLYIQSFHFHPKEAQRALALVKTDSKQAIYMLYETRNFGESWHKVAENMRSVSWGNQFMRPFDPNIAYAIRHHKERRSFVSVDLKTLAVQEILADGRAFSYSKSHLFVATGSSSEEASLFISQDNAQTLRKATISGKDTKQTKFTILDSVDGSIFINVLHSEFESEPWGTIYHSDSSGTRFSESLPFNRRSGPICDFHRIKSMEGVFISNVVENHEDEDCKKCLNFQRCASLCNHASRISYDRGLRWELLRGPKIDSKKEKVDCQKRALIEGTDHCQLNLHGLATRSAMTIHSHEDTVGVILATGNIGSELGGPMSKDTNVYISRDAGVTWEEIAKGPHLYEMMDQGSLMVIVPLGTVANTFSFTWDEGKTWTSASLAKNTTDIIKIRQGHAHDAKTMVIEGERNENTVLFFIDLSNVLQRICTGIDKPDSQESDYEYFKYRSQTTSKCFLGRKVDYVRRKRDAKCSNSGQRGRNKIERCACTYSDYECDFGYETSKGEGGEFICNSMKGYVPPTGPPRGCYTFYNVTRGYTKIAGDMCYGGIDLNPIRKACPNGLGFVGVVIVLLFSCAVCGFVSYFVHKNYASFRSRATEQYSQLDMNEAFNFDDEDEDAAEIDETLFRGNNDREEFMDENVRRKARTDNNSNDNNNSSVATQGEVLETGSMRLPSAPEIDESIFEDDDPVLESINIQGGSHDAEQQQQTSGFNPRKQS